MLAPVDDARVLAYAMKRFLTDLESAQRVGTRCQQFCSYMTGSEIIYIELSKFCGAL